MHDFKCTNPDDMYYEILRNRVKYFKEGEGQEEMCEIWEKIRNKGKLEEKISTLLKQLTRKFGKTITIELKTEIENSNKESLDELAEAIFDVENEEDVFKVLHHSY
jgi:glutamyl-tRNA reductase